ncbi:MAG: phenylacetaldoxime dehydratase family protein [Rhizobacter sp.]
MESAIPKHLQTARSRTRRIPDDYTPPYPATVARFKPGVRRVVMAYFGLQYTGTPAPVAASRALAGIAEGFAASHGPGHWDRARDVDRAGYTNVISIGYWDDPVVFDAWFEAVGSRWTRGDPDAGIGTFVEVLRPAVERFETLFSGDTPEGVAAIAGELSEPVQEHAYWGGARDRIALSQTDALAPAGAPRIKVDGLRRTVIPHENVCLIRSGQDWSATQDEERRMYLRDVEPVLRAGMDFLRDEGGPVGCFSNRYMTVVDGAGRELDKSFGMGWWKSLAALERWSESHPTHVAIFGAAMKYLGTLGPAAKLKLYHEVTVAAAHEQFFEYFNCHPETGMLGVG